MNKFKLYFIVLITSLSLFSCHKNDSVSIEPLRPFADQYTTDITDIEDYLKTNYIEKIVNNPGAADDQDITITKIPDGGKQPSIMTYLNAPTYPKLLIRPVKLHGVDYSVYYLVLRPGVGQSPCNVDGILAAYRGTYLYRTGVTATTPSQLTATLFEEVKFPQSMLSLYNVVTGWSEVFPQFKTGTSVINADGSVTHNDFGAGVMFLPSGLGYYSTGSGNIPPYAPLIFSFKLYDIQRLDQDNDGIPSYLEDLNRDGYVYDYRNTTNYPTPPKNEILYADDTDEDGIPDFLDVDDDGDNYTTKLEITKPNGSNLLLDGPSLYFPYDPIISDPVKSTDEKRGVPSYSATGTPDYTSPGRLRIYLDKNHHTATP